MWAGSLDDNMTSKREKDKAAARAAILDAARRCFIETGYDAVTIRDVIRETGLTAAMFYNHFPDKESLLRELVDARLGQLQERIHASRQTDAHIADLFQGANLGGLLEVRSEEHTSELQSLMRISYAVFCLKKKTKK